MALEPIDEAHALQIQAGVIGRKAGHTFEDRIAAEINSLTYPLKIASPRAGHVFVGDPAVSLLNYVASSIGITSLTSAKSISTGALATSEEGKQWLSINGVTVSRCKSDLVLTLAKKRNQMVTLGVSTKQCNNTTCTNAQLYFTTARGFVNLLRADGIEVSNHALTALRQFCGDEGFRPDGSNTGRHPQVDPRRFFWEEILPKGRKEWEAIFAKHQDRITRLLLQKAYISDPFVPDYVLHKTKRSLSWDATEVAIYSVNELVSLSSSYQRFTTKPYRIRKGSHKDPEGISHQAPRFGIVQMQRGGQRQHPEQLQFNLEAGYFYHL